MNMYEFQPDVRDWSEFTREQQELIEAMKAWNSAVCKDCWAQFITQREADEHNERVHSYSVIHLYGLRAVN
jgi:hypothetical protein